MVDIGWKRAVALDCSEVDRKAEGPDRRVCHEDIGWSDYLCEPVPSSELAHGLNMLSAWWRE
jgi:hypothetical protein